MEALFAGELVKLTWSRQQLPVLSNKQPRAPAL